MMPPSCLTSCTYSYSPYRMARTTTTGANTIIIVLKNQSRSDTLRALSLSVKYAYNIPPLRNSQIAITMINQMLIYACSFPFILSKKMTSNTIATATSTMFHIVRSSVTLMNSRKRRANTLKNDYLSLPYILMTFY